MPGIFISYRRSDNPDATGRIYDRLVAEFGKSAVFKDVDSIPLGQDFRGHLNTIVGDCAVVLAIIGPRWSDFRNEAGQRRLEDPDDFVRIELEAALARDIPVVPVLVAHASLPGTSVLPSTLSSLAYRQSIEVRPDPDFHNDVTRLVGALKRTLDPDAEAEAAAPALPDAPAVNVERRLRRSLAWVTAVALVTLLAAAALAIPALKFARQGKPEELRLDIVTPESTAAGSFALSPDGRQIAYVGGGEGKNGIWMRALDTSVGHLLPGTEDAIRLFWSPDSKLVGYFTRSALKRVAVGGGQPFTITQRDFSTFIGGASWNTEDVILFAHGIDTGLMRVSAMGGAVSAVTTLSPGEDGHYGPMFLEDGRRFVYFTSNPSNPTRSGTYVGSLGGDAPRQLVEWGVLAGYLPTGWLILSRDGSIMAQQLDSSRSRPVGEPVVLVQSRNLSKSNARNLSTSTSGLIAYRDLPLLRQKLQWFDRSGQSQGVIDTGDVSFQRPRISPDGRRIAVDRVVGSTVDIWLIEGPRATRFASGQGIKASPVWSSNGGEIAFIAVKENIPVGMRKPLVGAAPETPIFTTGIASTRGFVPTSYSRDGRFLMVQAANNDTSGSDLFYLSLQGKQELSVWLQTPSREASAEFSPDGRWVAYMSNVSGQWEVYVRSFRPANGKSEKNDPTDIAIPVSSGGGAYPVWRVDGSEIYFQGLAGEIMAATVSRSGSSITFSPPAKLFDTRVALLPVPMLGQVSREFDVASDGRFLVNEMLDQGPAPPITLIMNWNPEATKAQR